MHTVEHVLAAVLARELDDVVIELSGPEPPVMDGSAQPFVEALREGGIAEQAGDVHYLQLRSPVRVCDGDSCTKRCRRRRWSSMSRSIFRIR